MSRELTDITLADAQAICSACNVCDDVFYHEEMAERLNELWPKFRWYADPDEQTVRVEEKG